MAALEDEDNQRKGFVAVLYNLHLDKVDDRYRELLTNASKINAGLPFRVVAVHYCYSNASLRPALALFKLTCSYNLRLRFRAHFGKMLQVGCV